MKHTLLIAFLFFNWFVKAQDIKRTQNWYFGDSAGLSFTADPPTVLTNGSMNTIEGCATISDTSGNLLFYTNGVTVWNKIHQVMENGTGLNGHISSTQSSLIVPWPGNDSLFYVFTTDALGQSNGLQYSLVNIKENTGLGKVVTKNVLLKTPVCEKIAASYHRNGKDIWVISHGWGNNSFYAYLITVNGIISCPIASQIGSNFYGNLINAQGSIKISFDGSMLASCVFDPLHSKIELFSLDNERGTLEFKNEITNAAVPSSIEFSYNNQFLYVSANKNSLLQYDISKTDINSSKYELLNVGGTSWIVTTLQMGLNKKIYISYPDSSFLGIINQPDSPALASLFIMKGISLNPKKSTYGLPNFISSYFYQPDIDFIYTTNCENDSIFFKAKGGTVHSWVITNNQAIIHTSNQPTTNYKFTDTGKYIVKLISGTDTVLKSIYIEPKLKLGKDTVICNQQAFKLIVPSNYRCINWQDGSDSVNYAVTQTGKYFVSAYNIKGCLVSDTINITFTTLSPPVITKRHDTLFTDSGSYTFNWKYNGNPIGGNSNFIVISQNGNYSVEITDTNGCTNTSGTFPVTGLNILLLDANSYFLIYPIPASDKLFVEPKGNIIIESLLLRDITGRTLEYSPATELSVQGLSKGIYLLEITDHLKTKYLSKIIIH